MSLIDKENEKIIDICSNYGTSNGVNILNEDNGDGAWKDSFLKKDYPYVYEFDSPIEFDDLINSVIKDDNEKKLIPPVTVGVFKLKNYTSEQNLPETIYNFW